MNKSIYFFMFILLANYSLAVDKQKDGVLFSCKKEEINTIKNEMDKYIYDLKIDKSLIIVNESKDGLTLGFQLKTPENDTNTLDFKKRKEFKIVDDTVKLPTNKKGKFKSLKVVSKKEIVLSLFQHGRLTLINDDKCSIQVFKDHVGIRQNIAAWTEKINWNFPNGGGSG